MKKLMLFLCLGFGLTTYSHAGDPYLQVVGDHLEYNGRTVILRGINYNNGPAMDPSTPISLINVNDADYQQTNEGGPDPAHPNGLGANLIRWGLNMYWYMNDTDKINHSNFYGIIDRHIAWARAHHIWVIPNLFIAPGNITGGFGGQGDFWDAAGSQANRDATTAFWHDFAKHYANNPTIAGYDIINEPSPSYLSTYADWANQVYSTITAVDPNHFVAIESISYTSRMAVNVNLPAITTAGTPRIVWSQHCYPAFSPNTLSGDNCAASDIVSSLHAPVWIGETGVHRDGSGTGGDLGAYPNYLAYFNSHQLSTSHHAWLSWWQPTPGDWGLYGFVNGTDQPAGQFGNPWDSMISLLHNYFTTSLNPDGTTGNIHPSAISISVLKPGDGQGTVTSDTGGINCGGTCNQSFDSTITITLTAARIGIDTFSGWGGSACASFGTSPCTLTIDGDYVVTANFDAAPSAPTITVQPSSLTGLVNGTATFNVTARGKPAPGYQWQKNVSGTWSDIILATQSAYTTPTLALSDSGSLFRVTISNSQGSVISNSATLTVSTGDPSMLAWWKMDEGSGSAVGDSTGRGNVGTLVGSPQWVAGVGSGSALSFDGSSNYVSLLNNANSLNVARGGGESITGWVKTNDGFGCIVSFRNNSNGQTALDLCVGYDGLSTSAGHVKSILRYDDGTGMTDVTSPQVVNDNAWHFVAAVLDQSNSSLKVYVDGVASPSVTVSNGTLSFSSQLSLGAESNWIATGFANNDERYLNGSIDDVRVYGIALSASEVVNIYGGTPVVAYALTPTTSGPGSGSITCTGTGVGGCSYIPSGSLVNVTAAANAGSFVGGLAVTLNGNTTTAACAVGAPTCSMTVTVNTNGTASAVFNGNSASPTPTPQIEGFIPSKNVFDPRIESVQLSYIVSDGNLGNVTMAAYDRQGNKMKDLNAGTIGTDKTASTSWDGRNSDGQIVATGTYIVILKKGNKTFKKKVVVIK